MSQVRAFDQEWGTDSFKAGAERGMMVRVEEENLFRDHHGVPILNGAGGVVKQKIIDGNLIPSNTYQRGLEGDDRHLPYLGQLGIHGR